MRRYLFILIGLCVVAPAPAAAPEASVEVHPRIVSFTPALTNILFDMNLGHHVVGVTRWCTLPEGVDRPRIGDAQSINAELILSTRPDIIITQSDTARFKGVTDVDPTVQVVPIIIEELPDVAAAIDKIGELTDQVELAQATRAYYEARLDAVRNRVAGRKRMRVLFVMGTTAPSVSRGGTFVHDLIEIGGGINAGLDIPGANAWQRTHIDHIVATQPDVLICQVRESEADEAAEYWRQWEDLPATRAGNVYVVTDSDWTIPSLKLPQFAGLIAEMTHTVEVEEVDLGWALWRARVLRWLAAAVVGAALASGGMALQGLLRNPLAEPYILGISSGAGVGVLLGMALSAWLTMPAWLSTPLLAFAGAGATAMVVYALAQRRGRLEPYSLILSGVIVNTFNGAVMLAIFLYVDVYRISEFTHWAMGRLPDAIDVDLLIVSAVLVGIGWIVLFLHAASANVLTLGDSVAATSGVSVQWLRLVTFGVVALMTAAAVSLAGPIGFLGLIVPHIVRMIVGPDQRIGLIVSAAGGAVLLVLAEWLCRSIGSLIHVSLVPVGILTALIGGPFFVMLLRRQRGRAIV